MEPNTKQLNVPLPQPLMEALKNAAKARGMTLHGASAEAVRLWLRTLKPLSPDLDKPAA